MRGTRGKRNMRGRRDNRNTRGRRNIRNIEGRRAIRARKDRRGRKNRTRERQGAAESKACQSDLSLLYHGLKLPMLGRGAQRCSILSQQGNYIETS